MKLKDDDRKAIRDHFAIPDHIQAAASAVYYDLMHGPAFVRIPQGDVTKFTADDLATYACDLAMEEPGDLIEECYTSKVANALGDYLRELPSELYYDSDCGHVSEHEPEGWEDEDGTWNEPFLDFTYKLETKDVAEILFGRTVAYEFSY